MSTTTIKSAPAGAEVKTVTMEDVFTRAADLLEEFGWCQGAAVRDENGERMANSGLGSQPGDCLMSERAASFCLWGAIGRAAMELGVTNTSYDTPGWVAIIDGGFGLTYSAQWNDNEGRIKAEVTAALRSWASEHKQPLPTIA